MTAPRDEAPAGGAAQGFKAVAQLVSHHSAPEDAQRKAEASMAARAAMNGCSMYGLAGGGYLLCRWGLSRACPDLRSVGALLDRLAGAA